MRLNLGLIRRTTKVKLRINHTLERALFPALAPPPITAKAACVIEAGTLRPLLRKNANLRFPPASLTKLATALLFSRASQGRWDERVTVTGDVVARGSTAGLVVGEEVTRRELLEGIMGPSGNDAASLAARLIGPGFDAEMRRLTEELGMTRTSFLNPHGLDAPGHLSTAADLARLAAAAFSDPAVAEAGAKREGSVNGRPWTSTVTILGEPNVIAGKTGSTGSARGCLALAWRRELIVVLGSSVEFDQRMYPIPQSDRRYDDARSLMAALSGGRERSGVQAAPAG